MMALKISNLSKGKGIERECGLNSIRRNYKFMTFNNMQVQF